MHKTWWTVAHDRQKAFAQATSMGETARQRRGASALHGFDSRSWCSDLTTMEGRDKEDVVATS